MIRLSWLKLSLSSFLSCVLWFHCLNTIKIYRMYLVIKDFLGKVDLLSPFPSVKVES